MLKRRALKKIFISLSCLIILFIVYLFPDKKQPINNINYKNKQDNFIYLIDNNKYTSRVSTVLTSTKIQDKIKEIINILTIGSNSYIRDGFKKVIPKNTKLLNLEIQNDLVKLNFSKEFYNVDIYNEEKMIESIVYSLTSLDNIKYVSIFVEGKIFNKLPNSNKKINTVLDRNIGINKEYNISNITNTTKTTIYYLSKYNDFYYYVPVTKIQNEDSSKIEIIIKELTSSNLLNTNLISYLNSNICKFIEKPKRNKFKANILTIEEFNHLISLLNSNTELLSYNETDKSLFLNFNENILEDINTNNILEEVSYSINLSIKDNYDVNNVVYYVNDKVISTFNIK